MNNEFAALGRLKNYFGVRYKPTPSRPRPAHGDFAVHAVVTYMGQGGEGWIKSEGDATGEWYKGCRAYGGGAVAKFGFNFFLKLMSNEEITKEYVEIQCTSCKWAKGVL